jgi:hypothetical protein
LQDVVTLQVHKVAKTPLETNRNFITIGKAINAAGDTIPPLCVIKGLVILHLHVLHELNLNPSMLLRVTELGYLND